MSSSEDQNATMPDAGEASVAEQTDVKTQDAMLLELQEEVKRLRLLVDHSSRPPAVPKVATSQVSKATTSRDVPGAQGSVIPRQAMKESPRGHHAHAYMPQSMKDHVPGIRDRRPSPGLSHAPHEGMRERRTSPLERAAHSPPPVQEVHVDADTMDPENPDPKGPEKPDKDMLGWEWRGNAWGLILDDGVAAAWYFFLLLVILFGVWGDKRWQTPCPLVLDDSPSAREKNAKPSATMSVGVCEYTKAYILCFPEIGLAVLLCLVGRNLIQKRFYYGLLKRGGVMNYCGSEPKKDPLVWALLWCYCHILLFLVLVIFNGIEPPDFGSGGSGEGYTKDLKEAQKTTGGAGVETESWLDAATLALILNLAGFIVLPGTICVLFIYVAYNIEYTLVPLSRFVHCAQERASAMGNSADSEFDDVCLLQDNHLKALVDTQRSFMQDAYSQGGLDAMYKEVLSRYRVDEALRLSHPELQSPSSVTLINSLWPGKLILHILNQSANSEGMTGFLWLWRAFLATAVTISFMLLAFLGERLWFSVVLTTWNGTIGWQDGCRLLVELAHFLAVICVLFRVAQVTFVFMDKVPDPTLWAERQNARYKELTKDHDEVVKPHPWGKRCSRRPW